MVLEGKNLIVHEVVPAGFNKSTGVVSGYIILVGYSSKVAGVVYRQYLPKKLYFVLQQDQLLDHYGKNVHNDVERLNNKTKMTTKLGYKKGQCMREDLMVLHEGKTCDLTHGGNPAIRCVGLCYRNQYVKEARELQHKGSSKLLLPNCLPLKKEYIGQVFSNVTHSKQEDETGFHIRFTDRVFGFARCSIDNMPSELETVSVTFDHNRLFIQAPYRMQADDDTKDVLFNVIYKPKSSEDDDSVVANFGAELIGSSSG